LLLPQLIKLLDFTFVRRPWKIQTTHQGVAMLSLRTMAVRHAS